MEENLLDMPESTRTHTLSVSLTHTNTALMLQCAQEKRRDGGLRSICGTCPDALSLTHSHTHARTTRL